MNVDGVCDKVTIMMVLTSTVGKMRERGFEGRVDIIKEIIKAIRQMNWPF